MVVQESAGRLWRFKHWLNLIVTSHFKISVQTETCRQIKATVQNGTFFCSSHLPKLRKTKRAIFLPTHPQKLILLRLLIMILKQN